MVLGSWDIIENDSNLVMTLMLGLQLEGSAELECLWCFQFSRATIVSRLFICVIIAQLLYELDICNKHEFYLVWHDCAELDRNV